MIGPPDETKMTGDPAMRDRAIVTGVHQFLHQ
jgi:hypothetical protein